MQASPQSARQPLYTEPKFIATMPLQTPSPTAPHAPDLAQAERQPWRLDEHWPELVEALTEASVSAAQQLSRGLELMRRRQRLSASEHEILSQPVERLKRAGVQAQQIARLRSGQARLSHEKIDLASLTEAVLQDRREELDLLGVVVARDLNPVEVLLDPSLGFGLVSTMLEWGMGFAHRLHWQLGVDPENQQARLCLTSFPDTAPEPSAFDGQSLPWLLLRQMVASDGNIAVTRQVDGQQIVLCVSFNRSLSRVAAAVAESNG